MFWQVLDRDKGFLVATEFFWFYVRTRVPCVATWLSGLMQLLGRDIAFFHVVTCSVLLLCRDNVAIEDSLSRPRWSRPEVRCCNLRIAIGLALARDFMSRQSLVKVKGFHVVIENFYIVKEFPGVVS